MGIVKERKGRPRYPESMSGNGKEGEKDGRERGRQQGGGHSKFTCPTILQSSSWLRALPGLPAAAPTVSYSLMNVTLHAYRQCLCLCWRFYSLEASHLSLAPPTSSHTCTCVSTHPNIFYYINIKSLFRNAPGGPVVKNLPINAGDMSSIPGPEDSTCLGASKLLCHNYWSLRALEPMLYIKRIHGNEKPVHRN